MIKTKLKRARYTDEAYDFVTDLVRLKNIVIQAQRQEIRHLRDILTRRV